MYLNKSKKNKGKKILLPVLICFIMITSILGFMSSSGSDKIEYNGYKFNKVDNGWSIYKNDKKIILLNNPNDLEDYEAGIGLNDLNSAQKLYLSINPLDNLFLSTLQNNIFPFLTQRLVMSCYEDNEKCKDFPLKTCENIDKNTRVILIKKSENSKFYYKDSCLVIQGSKEEIIKMIDKLTLELLFNEY